MPVATITVKFVNPPKPGKKSGSINTDIGFISVWPDKLNLFEKGYQYTIEYSVNGDFKNFIRMANQPPQQGNGGYSPPPAPAQSTYRQPQTSPVRPDYAIDPPQGYRPQPSQGHVIAAPTQKQSSQKYTISAPKQIDVTALNIFTTGLVGRALGSGHFSPDDIDELTANAVAAFKRHLAGSHVGPDAQPVDPQFDDPLPDQNFYNPEEPPFP